MFMENTDNQSYKDRLRSRYASRYPEDDLNDDEQLGARIADELDEFDRRMKEYEDKNARMVALFTKDPRSAEFLNAWAAGGDPLVFLLDTFGDEFKEALESEDGRKAFVESHEKWLKRQAEDKEARDKSEENFRKSLDDLESFRQEHNLSEQEAADVFKRVHQVGANVIDGIYTPEDYLMALRSMRYEGDIEAARADGKIEGRNEKIEEKLHRDEQLEQIPPDVAGSGAAAKPREQKPVYDPWGLMPEDR